jgi:hypothetical protein
VENSGEFDGVRNCEDTGDVETFISGEGFDLLYDVGGSSNDDSMNEGAEFCIVLKNGFNKSAEVTDCGRRGECTDDSDVDRECKSCDSIPSSDIVSAGEFSVKDDFGLSIEIIGIGRMQSDFLL